MHLPNKPLLIKTIAMPADTNRHGDIFGGWIVSQMDLAGAVFANYYTRQKFVTVAINEMVFQSPVSVGDLVQCFGSLERKGKSSITVTVEVWVERYRTHHTEQVGTGKFVYVALDKDGKPTPITWEK